MLDWLAETNAKMREGLLAADKPWNKEPDIIHRLVVVLAELSGRDTEILAKIRKELEVKCKHPKKFRDIDPKSRSYCVCCNQDL